MVEETASLPRLDLREMPPPQVPMGNEEVAVVELPFLPPRRHRHIVMSEPSAPNSRGCRRQ